MSATYVNAVMLADSLRWAVDLSESMLAATDSRSPLRVLRTDDNTRPAPVGMPYIGDNSWLAPVDELYIDDADERLEALSGEVAFDVRAAVREWRDYLVAGVEAALNRLRFDWDRHGAEDAMRRAIAQADEHCGALLRRQAARLEEWAQALPEETSAQVAASAEHLARSPREAETTRFSLARKLPY